MGAERRTKTEFLRSEKGSRLTGSAKTGWLGGRVRWKGGGVRFEVLGLPTATMLVAKPFKSYPATNLEVEKPLVEERIGKGDPSDPFGKTPRAIHFHDCWRDSVPS